MIELVRYRKQEAARWNQLLDESLIDSFLFHRDYMDYHESRFLDHSFLIFRKGKLAALLSGNSNGTTYYSHQGLTYGGIIATAQIKAVDVLVIFEKLIAELRLEGISEIIYKPTPFIYQKQPSQEDVYALFKLGAQKIACHLSSAIFLKNKSPFSKARKEGIKNAINSQVQVRETERIEAFYPLLEANLRERYQKTPTHSLNELRYLKSKFPHKIRCFIATQNDATVAGCILYEMKKLVHVQYIAANSEGKNAGALDLVFDNLINDVFQEKEIFDFGHSNEASGKVLNESLIFQKEGFGARGILYETYRLNP